MAPRKRPRAASPQWGVRIASVANLALAAAAAVAEGSTGADDAPSNLRGRGLKYAQDVHSSLQPPPEAPPTLQANLFDQPSDTEDAFILEQPASFQITISIALGIIALLQLLLLGAFTYHRRKRVLEFAQPAIICLFIAVSTVTTGACYLYVYLSNVGCALREPLIFFSLSLMGATIAGRAWRVSALMSNPLMTTGRGTNDDEISRVERARKGVLSALTALSGCDFSIVSLASRSRAGNGGGSRPLRVQITVWQMLRAIALLCVPQILLQVVVIGVPSLRSTKTTTYSESFGVAIGQYSCQSSAPGSWPIYIGVLFAILPYACAYLLNLRPKKELDHLPEICDERHQLDNALAIFVRVAIITAPVIGMTFHYMSPAIRSYASVCLVLGISLSLVHQIAFVKIVSATTSKMKQHRRSRSMATPSFSSNAGGGGDGRGSAAFAVKMAEMYGKIGRSEETIELVEETLDIWRKGNGGGVFANQEGREEIGSSGFSRTDLRDLEPDELQLIIQLHVIKGDALMRIHGPKGFPLSAEMNINAMRLFEQCPASKGMNPTLMFPIYNRVIVQLKGGVIEQDDACSLEMDLAERFCHEAQVQSYHYARSLGNLAEWYGRIGAVDKAVKYLEQMRAVYMPKEHTPLLYSSYAVNRCDVSLAVSALWFLLDNQVEKALERCDEVIKTVLPRYDKEGDMVGLLHIFIPLLRVLKFNGQVDKARKVYNDNAPEGASRHFAMGPLHKPMCLLLRICDGSSEEKNYNTDDMAEDIEIALSFEPSAMEDLIFACDGWSFRSLAAELCLHLARRLKPGDPSRERLLDRGIEMSTIANKQVKAANGAIKHILAYNAHKGIDDRLLALRLEDNGVARHTIYGENEQTSMSLSTRNFASPAEGPIMRRNGHGPQEFASKFRVKGSNFSQLKGSGNSAGGSVGNSGSDPGSSLPSRGKSKAKVTFSSLMSEGTASQHSVHSNNSKNSNASLEDKFAVYNSRVVGVLHNSNTSLSVDKSASTDHSTQSPENSGVGLNFAKQDKVSDAPENLTVEDTRQ